VKRALLLVALSLAIGVVWALVCWQLGIDGYAFMLGTGLLMIGAFAVVAALYPSTTTGRSREAARVQDPYEDQARGVDC
jgi:hypothetical protein